MPLDVAEAGLGALGAPSGVTPERQVDLDGWMRRHLHRAYDGILSEPVPEALLRLAIDHENERAIYQWERASARR
ncbi:hypothetical protein VQH23_00135 [Pararoseomonas sp. SCSIO 73927]|uniref:hypothetical protein n=1 Tax=Pararoseomonas sp. SCSIO 73927 TaxID=3114537 RepID=UPI0030CB34A3